MLQKQDRTHELASLQRLIPPIRYIVPIKLWYDGAHRRRFVHRWYDVVSIPVFEHVIRELLVTFCFVRQVALVVVSVTLAREAELRCYADMVTRWDGYVTAQVLAVGRPGLRLAELLP